MAEATGIKGGRIKVLLGNDADPIVYGAPCGLTSRTLTFNKGLEEFQMPDCDDPDLVTWLGRDAISLSMSISGDTVFAQESAETWLDAFEDPDAVPIKVVCEFPAKTITWTGRAQVETFEVTGQNNRRSTGNVSLQSDGKMTRVVS